MKSILCNLAVEEAHNSLLQNHPDKAILSLCNAISHLNGVEEKDKPEKKPESEPRCICSAQEAQDQLDELCSMVQFSLKETSRKFLNEKAEMFKALDDLSEIKKAKPESKSILCWLSIAKKCADDKNFDLAFHALASAVQKLSERSDSNSNKPKAMTRAEAMDK